jgi:hypothetical protein
MLVLFFLVTCLGSWAADTELQVGNAYDGALIAPKTDSYSVLLKAGDLADANVVIHGSKLIVSVYRPSGSKVRGFRFNGVDWKIAFVADDPGDYRLKVGLDAKTNKGTYTITLTKITSLEDRVAPPTAERYESPRIQALRSALKSGRANAVEAFWAEVKMKGTPLIEPLPGNDKDMLVTFLWRATTDTRNVSVRWDANGNYVVFNFSRPDDYQLTRLGETDVWYKSVRVDKRKRFMYQLVVNGPPLHPSQDLPSDNIMSLFAASSQPDPLNRHRWLVNFSAVEMPSAPPQPWAHTTKRRAEGQNREVSVQERPTQERT